MKIKNTFVLLACMAAHAWAQTPTSPAGTVSATATQAVVPEVDVKQVLGTGPLGTQITSADILADFNRLPPESRRQIMARPDSVEQVVKNLLVRQVLAREAEQDELLKDPLMQAMLNLVRDRVLSDLRLQRMDMQNEPSAEALERYARDQYRANPAKFQQPAQTRARHILINKTDDKSIEEARGLLVQLKAGANFEELAKAHSKDPGSAARGGDLGFFGAGRMVRPFEDAVNALKNPGDLSDVVESQFGYHIIRLEERQAARTASFDEVKQQLIGEARNALLSEARAQKVGTLHQAFKIDRAAIESLSKIAQ